VLSNEGRELNAYWIQKFKLGEFGDSSVSSCFVHPRKPDADIFSLVLDIARPQPGAPSTTRTLMFAQIADGLGILEHSSHGLWVDVRETGFVRITERRGSHP